MADIPIKYVSLKNNGPDNYGIVSFGDGVWYNIYELLKDNDLLHLPTLCDIINDALFFSGYKITKSNFGTKHIISEMRSDNFEDPLIPTTKKAKIDSKSSFPELGEIKLENYFDINMNFAVSTMEYCARKKFLEWYMYHPEDRKPVIDLINKTIKLCGFEFKKISDVVSVTKIVKPPLITQIFLKVPKPTEYDIYYDNPLIESYSGMNLNYVLSKMDDHHKTKFFKEFNLKNWTALVDPSTNRVVLCGFTFRMDSETGDISVSF